MSIQNFNTNELLKLQLLCYDNPKRAHIIITTFDSYAHFEKNTKQFITTTIKQPQHQKNFQNRLATLQEKYNTITNQKIPFISINNNHYPNLLREINYHPLILFFTGNIKLANTPQIAIVGSRKCSEYAKKTIQTLIPPLLPHFSITSGLAEGVDTLAHQEAINHNNPTIAVVGNGLDIIYPAKNANLYQKIKQNGLVLSEFPPGTPGVAHHFPQRNRIVSGLSKGIVVIEAQEKSGALITANHALEQNRDVFAVPGSITSETSQGCHKLIQDGAKLVQNSNDILNEFHIQTFQKPLKTNTPLPSDLSEHESNLIKQLTKTPQPFDQLVEITKLPVQTLLQTLTLLEIKGLITQHSGQQFSRI